MFAAWGHFVYRQRWGVLVVSVVMLVASGFIASQGGKLESGGFIETAESGRASKLIEKELPRSGGSTFTLIFSSASLDAKGAEFRAAVDTSLQPLRSDPRIDSIATPYDATSADPSRQISKDGHEIAVDAQRRVDLVLDLLGDLLMLVQELLGVVATLAEALVAI